MRVSRVSVCTTLLHILTQPSSVVVRRSCRVMCAECEKCDAGVVDHAKEALLVQSLLAISTTSGLKGTVHEYMEISTTAVPEASSSQLFLLTE